MSVTTIRATNGLTETFTSQVGETVVYPRCQRGEPEGYGHRFHPAPGLDEFRMAEIPLLFCELCGQVRKLEYEP